MTNIYLFYGFTFGVCNVKFMYITKRAAPEGKLPHLAATCDQLPVYVWKVHYK